MTEPFWSATDWEEDHAELDPPDRAVAPSAVLALLTVSSSTFDVWRSFWVDAEAARGLRDALDRLLPHEEQPAAPDPASLYIGRRAAAIGRQLDEHVQALARVTQRAQDLDGAPMPVSLKVAKLTELVHLLAVQEQRVAASLGDLLSELAGGQP
jgi:hypothetical protein